mgnify:CR=1
MALNQRKREPKSKSPDYEGPNEQPGQRTHRTKKERRKDFFALRRAEPPKASRIETNQSSRNLHLFEKLPRTFSTI